MPVSKNLGKIDHIVVLMLENRSFDNMLGWLHDPKNPPPFDDIPAEGRRINGVTADTFNPIPDFAGGGKVRVSKGEVMTNPNPDPGEEYYHVNTQLFGTVCPEGNRFAIDPPPVESKKILLEILLGIHYWVSSLFGGKKGKKGKKAFRAPFNLPPPPVVPKMNGFVQDYIGNFTATQGKAPTRPEFEVIMECFPPEKVPVISRLAQQFAVCDAYHSSVPSQTFCNRSFVHSATSNGLVINAPYVNWLFTDADTIFNRVEEDPNLSWKVYFDELDVASLTWLIQPKLKEYRTTNFFFMDRFHEDASSGDLPSYSFLEPRLFIDHNDQHPPIANPLVLSSVLAGELLIKEVYEAIRDSPCWEKTLLVITYDEHGGCFDHEGPPPAVPPDAGAPVGQCGFGFDRLGIRVPAVLISPWIEKGTVVTTLHDHTSIIKTVTKRWGLRPLTERDKAATDLGEVLSLDTPRTDKVEVHARDYDPSGIEPRDEKLHGFQRAVLALAAAAETFEKMDRDDHDAVAELIDLTKLLVEEGEIAALKTVGDGIDFMKEKLQSTWENRGASVSSDKDEG